MCNHRFCKQCIKDHIEGKINEAQVSEEDLTCPYDAIPIDINIIKANTTQIIFEKLITFRMNRIQLSVNDDEILFRCPGSPGINCQFMGILQRILEEFKKNDIPKSIVDLYEIIFSSLPRKLAFRFIAKQTELLKHNNSLLQKAINSTKI